MINQHYYYFFFIVTYNLPTNLSVKIFPRNFRGQAIILFTAKFLNYGAGAQATSIESGCPRQNFKRRQIRRVERSVDDVSSCAA